MKSVQLFATCMLMGLCFSTPSSAQSANDAYFQQLSTERVPSDPSVQWTNFGRGMSGYCEEFWCRSMDTNVMFMGPDMHVSFGTWDGGESWQTMKDCDGLGQEMKRVLNIEFSRQDPDFGIAIDWNGWATACWRSILLAKCSLVSTNKR